MADTFHFAAHHKCATNWLVKYLTDFSERNGRTIFLSHLTYADIPEDADVILQMNAVYEERLPDPHVHRVHVVRNPLDIIVSAYHSHRRTHSDLLWPELTRQRRVLEAVSDEAGLFLTLAFLERDDFHSGAVGPLHALRHWRFDDADYRTIRMEDMVAAPSTVLAPILGKVGDGLPPDHDHSFAAISGRTPGRLDETSHYRSGTPDRWRIELPPAVVDYVRTHFEEMLRLFYPAALVD